MPFTLALDQQRQLYVVDVPLGDTAIATLHILVNEIMKLYLDFSSALMGHLAKSVTGP